MQQRLKQDLVKIKQREYEFAILVENCSREDLAKCAKFLAMYIALYRQKFGDIPDSGYRKLMDASVIDNELLEIIDDGMYEAAEMLKLILLQKNEVAEKSGVDLYIN